MAGLLKGKVALIPAGTRMQEDQIKPILSPLPS